MLKHKNRLKQKKDFEKVFKRGSNFRSKFLVLRTAKNKNKEVRFGIVVSHKVSKLAVDRNRIKRIIREAVKPYIDNMKGLDVVFVTLPGIKNKEAAQIRDGVIDLLKHSKLLKIKP